MRRFSVAVLAVGALLVAPGSASAQEVRWGIAAGLLMPVGNYGDADKMGFVGGVGGTYWMSGVGIRGELSLSTTGHDGGVSGSTRIVGGMASIVYALSSARGPRPYVMGGLGLYSVRTDVGGVVGSETGVGFGVGGGVSFPLGAGGSRLFAETRFTSVSTTGSPLTFLPVVVGISF